MESEQADCFVLPELFNTGYNFIDRAEVEGLAEPAEGPTFRTMREFAEKKSCLVAYGFAEKGNGASSGISNNEQRTSKGELQSTCYNSAALVGPKGLVGLYRKVHLYNRENLFFSAGDLGFPVFDTAFGKIGIMVCFDWFYPESARTLALRGAQLIAHPSNLVMPYCPDAMATRCLENRVFAATADRVGEEARGGVTFRYIGQSEIVSPGGKILARLGERETAVSVVEVDLKAAANKRLNEYNDLFGGRRPDAYAR
jgi:predicted amidohydrolase